MVHIVWPKIIAKCIFVVINQYSNTDSLSHRLQTGNTCRRCQSCSCSFTGTSQDSFLSREEVYSKKAEARSPSSLKNSILPFGEVCILLSSSDLLWRQGGNDRQLCSSMENSLSLTRWCHVYVQCLLDGSQITVPVYSSPDPQRLKNWTVNICKLTVQLLSAHLKKECWPLPWSVVLSARPCEMYFEFAFLLGYHCWQNCYMLS